MTKKTPEQIQRHVETKRQWQRKNREKLNRRRRARYANDPEYRAKALSYGKPKTDNTVREIDGVSVNTFTVAQTAEMFGVSRQAIHLWIKKGDIPSPLFSERPILFTSTQVALMQKLVDAGMNQTARTQAKTIVYKHWKSTAKINPPDEFGGCKTISYENE